jgi:hypothetical protein
MLKLTHHDMSTTPEASELHVTLNGFHTPPSYSVTASPAKLLTISNTAAAAHVAQHTYEVTAADVALPHTQVQLFKLAKCTPCLHGGWLAVAGPLMDAWTPRHVHVP